MILGSINFFDLISFCLETSGEDAEKRKRDKKPRIRLRNLGLRFEKEAESRAE